VKIGLQLKGCAAPAYCVLAQVRSSLDWLPIESDGGGGDRGNQGPSK